MEQQFQLKRIEGLLKEASREDIITVFMALQEQVLCTVKQRQTTSNEMVDSPDFINLKSRFSLHPW